MIQAWKDLRFSAKLTLIFFLVLSLTIGVITIRQSYSSFRLLEEKSLEDMENLAEQVILNFTQTLEDIENSCYVAMISREVPKNMSGSATYAVQKYTLATMISSATSYDYIMTRNSQRQLISTDFRNDMPTEQRSQIEADCRTILEEHQENTLGSCQWIRMDSGHVYLLRDVYDTQPLRHMGVIVLHIRQPFFAASSASENTGFLFLDKNGDFLTYTGTELPEGMTDEVIADAQAGTLPSKNNWSGGEYFAVSVAGSQWSVIVICSTQSYRTGCRQIMQNGIALGALGLLAGMALVYILTRSVLKKLGEIKKSMKEVANGNFDSRIEVTDADDISQLALAFNDMSQRISELMAELVEKERMRSNAELQVLEYKYRAGDPDQTPLYLQRAGSDQLHGENQGRNGNDRHRSDDQPVFPQHHPKYHRPVYYSPAGIRPVAGLYPHLSVHARRPSENRFLRPGDAAQCHDPYHDFTAGGGEFPEIRSAVSGGGF